MERIKQGIKIISGIAFIIMIWYVPWHYIIYPAVNKKVEEVDTCNYEDIDKAIRRMGSLYFYRVNEDCSLEVNKGDGKWLKLVYRKEGK